MKNEDRQSSSRSALRRVAVIAVALVGVLATVATSQPRWELLDEQALTFAEGDKSKKIEVVTSSKNVVASQEISFTLQAAGAGGADKNTWSLKLRGAEPSQKALDLNAVEIDTGKRLIGFVQWSGSAAEPDRLPTCSGDTCRMQVTVERDGEALAPVEVEIEGRIGHVGEGKPPGGKAFDLEVID